MLTFDGMYQFALIGCGAVAPLHIEQITKIGKLKAICDIEVSRANRVGGQYNAAVYSSIEDLLANEKEVDIVCICTPTGYHAEHCIKSLQAGKHVLCEKPFCITGAAAWQIIETAKFSRKKLVLVESRMNDSLQGYKTAITNDEFGILHHFQLSCIQNPDGYHLKDWKTKSFPAGNALLHYFQHQVETLMQLLGDIEIAKTIIANNRMETELDTNGASALQMKNGVYGTINWSVAESGNKSFELTLHTEKGKQILNADATSNYEFTYQKLVKEIGNKASFATNTNDVKVIEAIEKIYRSTIPQTEE